MNKLKLPTWLAAGVLVAAISAAAQPAKIFVAVDQPGHSISPTLWGIFFEDINLSADGGIYPELVRNRSFEDADTPEFWKFANVGDGKSEASVIMADEHAQPPPLNAFNRKSLRVKVDGAFTLQNEGYWGMNIVTGDSYTLKLAVRGENFTGKLSARILSANGTVLASGDIAGVGNQWKYQTLALTAGGGDPKATLEISGDGQRSFVPRHGFADVGEDLEKSRPAARPRGIVGRFASEIFALPRRLLG